MSWGAAGGLTATSSLSQQQQLLGIAVQAGAAGNPAAALQNVRVSTLLSGSGFGPTGIAFLGNSLVFCESFAGSLVLLSALGAVTTLASGFMYPQGIAVDPTTDNVIVADGGNNCLKSVTPAGSVSILVGSASGVAGSSNGAGTSALLSNPVGVAINSAGLIAVADSLLTTSSASSRPE